MAPPDSEDLDDVDAAVAEARREFVAGFEARCDRMSSLLDHIGSGDSAAVAAELVHLLHRMAGMGGTIGFPTVSARARELEDMIRDAPEGGVNAADAREMLAALRTAFHTDLSR
jgi:HPt (histidine-containing phosphotransfer) domain-containing protein